MTRAVTNGLRDYIGLQMPLPRKLDIPKAVKAKARGQSYAQIAKDQGVHPSTVHQALKPILSMVASPEQLEEYRREQANILDTIAAKTLQSITDEDYEKASLLQKTTAVAVLIDKSRLISGQSTSNSLIIHANATDAACNAWGSGHVIDAEPTD